MDDSGVSPEAPTTHFANLERRVWTRYSGRDEEQESAARRDFATQLNAQVEGSAAACETIECPPKFDDQGTVRFFAERRDYARIPTSERYSDERVSRADCFYGQTDFIFTMRWAQAEDESLLCPDQVSTSGRVESTEVQALVTFPHPTNPDRAAFAAGLFDQVAPRAKPCP